MKIVNTNTLDRKTALTLEERQQYFAELEARLTAEEHKNDNVLVEKFDPAGNSLGFFQKRNSTGVAGKGYEPIVRDLLTAAGLATEADFRARGANKSDGMTSFKLNAFVGFEIKSGAGALSYASNYGLRSFREEKPSQEHVFPYLNKRGRVIYTAHPDELLDVDDVLDNSFVLTKEEFVEALILYCHGKRKSGWHTAVKYATNSLGEHYAINIQSTYLNEFFDGISLSGNYLTLREYLLENGRQYAR